MIIFDADDFGANHVISDMCQSHDCRDQLDKFHIANPAFKATLFAIPGEMTPELMEWCMANDNWIELAVHGIYHSSNYECADMTYDRFDELMNSFISDYFVKGFKAPGWQISDACYEWLYDHDWWVADQEYNDMRRPIGLKTYKVGENSMHHHTWDCVGNGVYEQEEYILDRIKDETDFKFVSEVINGN
jgi:hypothetical protein